MSLTLAERERWIAEINRLNREGWAEAKRQRVQAIQAATGMSFSDAWDKAERDGPQPEPTNIGEAAKLIQAQHGWSFAESWDYAEKIYPNLVKGHSAGDPLTGRDPRISREVDKHRKLEDAKAETATVAHVAMLKRIRELREQNPSWSFDDAFSAVCRENMETQKAAADESKPCGTGQPEHPFLVEATRRGLMLVEGGFMNPIFSKGTASTGA